MATNYEELYLSASCDSDSSNDSCEYQANTINVSLTPLGNHELSSYLNEFQPVERKKIRRIQALDCHISSVPDVLALFCNIVVLDLSNNALRLIPECITRLTCLTKFCVRNNLLGGPDFEGDNVSLPKHLYRLKYLTDLNASGNRFMHIPSTITRCINLRNLLLGGNEIKCIGSKISRLKNLRFLYLGGNALVNLPVEISQLTRLKALILCDNQLTAIPDCISKLRRLECLQLHQNCLTTLPHALVLLGSLTELSLRANPLVKNFVRSMSLNPSSLLELAARVITVYKLMQYDRGLRIPASLEHFLETSHRCVNSKCQGVYFNNPVETVKFVDFCGMYKVPFLQYLCSSRCSTDHPAVLTKGEEINRIRKVLLG